MSEKDQKGEMSGGGTFEFFVVNLTTKPLTGTVTWSGGSRKVPLDVNGLQPGTASARKAFSPQGGVKDQWQWSARGRAYQLNIYDGDQYTVVVISDYGIGVLVTATAPDTWKW
jgi:hypothetical protein